MGAFRDDRLSKIEITIAFSNSLEGRCGVSEADYRQ